MARLPQIKTLEQFQWSWPKKINRLQVQNLFRLAFVAERGNVVLLGGVGLGKTHLAIALAYQACLQGHAVLFATAIDVVNNLVAAQNSGNLKNKLKKYRRPALLILDELGYLPIDKVGAANTLENFPFKKQPAVNKKQIMDLAQLDFIANAQDLLDELYSSLADRCTNHLTPCAATIFWSSTSWATSRSNPNRCQLPRNTWPPFALAKVGPL